MKIIRCATLEWDVFEDSGAVQWCDEFLGADAQSRADILRDIKRQIDIRYAQALRETGHDLRATSKTGCFAPSHLPASVLYPERTLAEA